MTKYEIGKVAYPERYATQPCNLSSSNRLTGATSSVKDLANRVLLRNQRCNSDATMQLELCTLTLDKLDPELKELLGEELDYYIANPDALKLVIELFSDRQKMRAGVIPNSYCYQAYCDNCGDIPLYTTGHFVACPFCLLGGRKQ